MKESASYHMVESSNRYVEIVLPLALPNTFTYYVPEDLIGDIQFGMRVEVPFGKSKLYSGIIIGTKSEADSGYRPKAILSILDKEPIINETHWRFWQWLAEYYTCNIGEVMTAALPTNLKLSSETIITLSPLYDANMTGLTDNEFMIAEALSLQDELNLKDVRDILNIKSVYHVITGLLDKKVIYLKEELKEKFKAKKINCVRLKEPYLSERDRMQEAFDSLKKSEKQTYALLAFLQLEKETEDVKSQAIQKVSGVSSTVIKAVAKKGIWEVYKKEVNRLADYDGEIEEAKTLSDQQIRALKEIDELFKEKQTVLLHGVTGSGKTRVYIELIQAAIERGEQVLYLLPEIALTTQLIVRLGLIFGDQIAVYHSRMNNHERVEVWQKVAKGQKKIVMGARSALFLPYHKLNMIVVDEEHDSSYKQRDPAPRYNGRDAAIVLANMFGAKTLLGTATPAIETYYNAQKGKYGLVVMPERFGGIEMPTLTIADAKRETKQRKMQSHFTSHLIEALKLTLENKEQAILFQNRRGYSPTLHCEKCAWHQECIHCDVSLTYHKFSNNLQCHYCGYSMGIPQTCPSCGLQELSLKGFGTEKIEDELKIYLPEAKVGRMDLDTVRTKNAHAKIINDFEEGRIDILVGTQMVTKGLDFENVGLVGVISADQLLQFPDFRASERGFQLITQVAGRAGRKKKQGKVIIQAMNTTHPVLKEVLEYDFDTFFAREIMERQAFRYPPFTRLIKITLKHKKPDTLNHGAKIFASFMKGDLGDRLKGPAVPYVSRVRGQYILDILIKLENSGKVLTATKNLIRDSIARLKKERGYSGVRVNVDVDPY